MPISGGKYVAPTWVDNAPPALGATELQAISDSVASYADPVAQVSWFTRPNLLDNWYFVGGGSQQGGGQFPINSVGKTTYTRTDSYLGYAIDRWILRDNNRNGNGITLQSGGLYLDWSGSGIQAISQTVENPTKLLGQTITLSALFGSHTGRIWLGLWWSATAGIHTSAIQTVEISSDLPSITVTLPTSIPSSYPILNIAILTYAGNTPTATVKAIKLELGATQTLAHQENGSWVLNEIPNFDEQYMRCVVAPEIPVRYETGSYTGTGTYGSGNANSISFKFVPKAVIVRHATSVNHGYFINTVSGMTSASYYQTVSWSGTTVGWYSPSSASQQMNESGATYNYIAIG